MLGRNKTVVRPIKKNKIKKYRINKITSQLQFYAFFSRFFFVRHYVLCCRVWRWERNLPICVGGGLF